MPQQEGAVAVAGVQMWVVKTLTYRGHHKVRASEVERVERVVWVGVEGRGLICPITQYDLMRTSRLQS